MKSTDSPAGDGVKRPYSRDEARGGDNSHRKMTENQGNDKEKETGKGNRLCKTVAYRAHTERKTRD